jgi:hypothetical protein
MTVSSLLAASLVLSTSLNAEASTSHAPVHMPNLIGTSRANVYAIMSSKGLYFSTSGPGSSNGTWVTVAQQSPAPGVLIAWHAQARIVTSMKPFVGPRRVPKLIGLSKAAVYKAMHDAGLFFDTTGPGAFSGTWTRAVGQNPAAGTVVKFESVVLVHVALPVVPKKPTPKPTTSTTTTTTTTIPGETTTTLPGETTTVPATTTTLKPAPKRYVIGVATWYSYVPGRCASPTLPFGTHVRVQNLATGKTIACVVTDRENASYPRVIDLSMTQFAQLSPLGKGVIRVRVSW